MLPEDILRALRHDPFQPVRFYLKDGRVFEIPHRNMVVVGRSYVDIGLQAADELPGICEGIVICAPEDIVRVERVKESETPVSG